MAKDKKKPGKKKAAKGSSADIALAEAIASFRIEADELSPLIKAAAFTSGGYPYHEKMEPKVYERDLEALQIELLKMLDWVRSEGQRIVVVFEGRDAAGKGGAIHRLTQHLNPRYVRIAALSKPTETEAGQWYFQRYIAEMPTAGEITIFDRSWYNRAGVEKVMGFCTPEQTAHFLAEVPHFETMLVRDGIRLVKIFLNVGHEMQLKRLHARHADPLKRWKLSPIDYKAIDKWDAYSEALDAMLAASDNAMAPWTIIKANDKDRARIAVIRSILTEMPYPEKDIDLVGEPDPALVLDAATFLGYGGEK